MQISTTCPNCGADLTLSAPVEEIRSALPEADAMPPEELKQIETLARCFAHDFSENGDARVVLWVGKEYPPDFVVAERFYEYTFVVEKLREYDIVGKNILDVGSGSSILPGILVAYGNRVTCLDVQKIHVVWPDLTVLEADLLTSDLPRDFDLVVCISTVEHFGLGRWGDKLDVDGDFKGMAKLRSCLKPRGKLILTHPVGQPTVLFPAHRVYDKSRFSKLSSGFRSLETRFFRVDQEINAYRPCNEIEVYSETNVTGYAIACHLLEKI